MIAGGLVMAALSLIVTGMACLVMGMESHFVALRGRAPDAKTRRSWRAGGWLLLGLALLPCLAGWPTAIGVVLWIGLTAGGVLIVALLLAFARR